MDIDINNLEIEITQLRAQYEESLTKGIDDFYSKPFWKKGGLVGGFRTHGGSPGVASVPIPYISYVVEFAPLIVSTAALIVAFSKLVDTKIKTQELKLSARELELKEEELRLKRADLEKTENANRSIRFSYKKITIQIALDSDETIIIDELTKFFESCGKRIKTKEIKVKIGNRAK